MGAHVADPRVRAICNVPNSNRTRESTPLRSARQLQNQDVRIPHNNRAKRALPFWAQATQLLARLKALNTQSCLLHKFFAGRVCLWRVTPTNTYQKDATTLCQGYSVQKRPRKYACRVTLTPTFSKEPRRLCLVFLV